MDTSKLKIASIPQAPKICKCRVYKLMSLMSLILKIHQMSSSQIPMKKIKSKKMLEFVYHKVYNICYNKFL